MVRRKQSGRFLPSPFPQARNRRLAEALGVSLSRLQCAREAPYSAALLAWVKRDPAAVGTLERKFKALVCAPFTPRFFGRMHISIDSSHARSPSSQRHLHRIHVLLNAHFAPLLPSSALPPFSPAPLLPNYTTRTGRRTVTRR